MSDEIKTPLEKAEYLASSLHNDIAALREIIKNAEGEDFSSIKIDLIELAERVSIVARMCRHANAA